MIHFYPQVVEKELEWWQVHISLYTLGPKHEGSLGHEIDTHALLKKNLQSDTRVRAHTHDMEHP